MFIPQPSDYFKVSAGVLPSSTCPLSSSRSWYRAQSLLTQTHTVSPLSLHWCSCLDHSFAPTLAKLASTMSLTSFSNMFCLQISSWTWWECCLNAVLLPYKSYRADIKLLGIISPASLSCVGCHGNSSSSSNLLYFSNLSLFLPNVRSAFSRWVKLRLRVWFSSCRLFLGRSLSTLFTDCWARSAGWRMGATLVQLGLQAAPGSSLV